MAPPVRDEEEGLNYCCPGKKGKDLRPDHRYLMMRKALQDVQALGARDYIVSLHCCKTCLPVGQLPSQWSRSQHCSSALTAGKVLRKLRLLMRLCKVMGGGAGTDFACEREEPGASG